MAKSKNHTALVSFIVLVAFADEHDRHNQNSKGMTAFLPPFPST